MFTFFANRPSIMFNVGIALNLVIMGPVFWFLGGWLTDALLAYGGAGAFIFGMPPLLGAGLIVFVVQLFFWNRWFEARVWGWRARVLGGRHA